MAPSGFKYVLVPAAASDAMQELTFDGISDLSNDEFILHLKQFFTNLGKGVDREILLKNMAEHAKKSVDDLRKELDPNVLSGICELQGIDIFPVMVPAKEFGYMAVSLYVDDKGIAKNLPLNHRAVSLIKACGYDDQQFRGDVFFSRIYDCEEDAWKRVDFTMKDCSSDAQWMEQCRQQRKKANSAQSLKDLQDTMNLDPNNMLKIEPNKKPPGGETEEYHWSDKGEEVEVKIKREAVKKTDVKVTFKEQQLKVQVASEVLLDVKLFARIECSDSTWTIMDGGLEITLIKATEVVWTSIVAI